MKKFFSVYGGFVAASIIFLITDLKNAYLHQGINELFEGLILSLLLIIPVALLYVLLLEFGARTLSLNVKNTKILFLFSIPIHLIVLFIMNVRINRDFLELLLYPIGVLIYLTYLKHNSNSD